VAVRQAALVSDESALEACACSRRCAIQIDDLYLFTFSSCGGGVRLRTPLVVFYAFADVIDVFAGVKGAGSTCAVVVGWADQASTARDRRIHRNTNAHRDPSARLRQTAICRLEFDFRIVSRHWRQYINRLFMLSKQNVRSATQQFSDGLVAWRSW